MYAAFFERLNMTPLGRKMLEGVDSFSAVSAGALVGTPLAMGVDPAEIADDMESGGLRSWLHWPRALLTAVGVWKGMYDGQSMYNRLQSMTKGKRLEAPISIGVTTSDMEQKSLQYTARNTVSSVLNCAVASASVPGLFTGRQVTPVGMTCDGGATKCTFPVDAILSAIRAGKQVVLFNCAPWAGFREIIGTRNERIFGNAFDVFNEHGMEWLPRELGPGFRYHDGIFRYGKVTFVAPTGAQYAASGGNKGAGNVFYSGNSAFTRRLRAEGTEIADSYIKKKMSRHI
jgi:hypothetical protein